LSLQKIEQSLEELAVLPKNWRRGSDSNKKEFHTLDEE